MICLSGAVRPFQLARGVLAAALRIGPARETAKVTYNQLPINTL